MKNLQNLSKEIYKLTSKIELEYPELYQHLDEMPATIPNGGDPELDVKDFEDYLESLQQLVQKYTVNHQKAQVLKLENDKKDFPVH